MRSHPSCWSKTLAQLGFRRKTRSSKRRLGVHGRTPRIEPLEARQMLSITVNTLEDQNNGLNGGTSLREALAQVATGDNTIDFDPALIGGTIQLAAC